MALHELDARHLLCPLPVIKTQQKIKSLAVGDRLKIISTDPGTQQDIPSWCKIFGHTLVSSEKEDREIIIVIEKEN